VPVGGTFRCREQRQSAQGVSSVSWQQVPGSSYRVRSSIAAMGRSNRSLHSIAAMGRSNTAPTRLLFVAGGLEGEEACVVAIQFHQFLVAAALDDAAVLNHDNLAGHTNSREPV
jgi:hypothetical protein